MTFILFILLTALLMEGIGSFISVVGLSAFFNGDLIILAMAVILDVAKIASVSFLYQYWGEIKNAMKIYMTAAVLTLMLITSGGAFVYLSGALQKAIQPSKEVFLRVDLLKKEQITLESELNKLNDRREKISNQIAQLPSNYSKSRRQLIDSFKPETNQIDSRTASVSKRLDEIRAELPKIEAENIDREVHVGPIAYLAKVFDTTMEDAGKWVILVIVAVFDPLAIMLVLAGNFLVKRRRDLIVAERTPERRSPIAPPEIKVSHASSPTSFIQTSGSSVSTPPTPRQAPTEPEEFICELPIPEDEQRSTLVEKLPELRESTPYQFPTELPESVMKQVTIDHLALLREGVVTPSKKKHLYE